MQRLRHVWAVLIPWYQAVLDTQRQRAKAPTHVSNPQTKNLHKEKRPCFHLQLRGEREREREESGRQDRARR